MLHRWRSIALAGFGLAGALALGATPPAMAIEEVLIKLPLVHTSFRVRVSELRSAQALRRGSSDLAELDRASDGALGRQLMAVLQKPLPLELGGFSSQAVGSPMLEQALLMVSAFGRVEGQPPDLSGVSLNQALQRASAAGPPTLISLIQALPGQRVTLDLVQAQTVLQRMNAQHSQAERLLAGAPVPAAATAIPAPMPVQRSWMSLVVGHRPQPLKLLVLQPQAGGNGQLVLISHGLWDSPESFEGWGQVLAGQGYSVVLPRHPGSDAAQQQAMLTGQAPPPNQEELELRPRDLSAVLDGLQQGRLKLNGPVNSQRVVALGHSWGATTVLQLAGMRPSGGEQKRCAAVNDPGRNLSWALQCSWLRGANAAEGLRDPRVVAVGAVSPPTSLLFPAGAGTALGAPVLLVSGSHDWVVPPDPEAIEPMRRSGNGSNRLVLARGGDHFNLRPGAAANGGPLGPLLLRWTSSAFNGTPLPSSGWSTTTMPLLDVSDRLKAGG